MNSTGISFLDTDYTDGHGLGLYCLNNGVIVQTMLPFHKCCRIYEMEGSVISEIRVRDFLSSPKDVKFNKVTAVQDEKKRLSH